MTDPTPYTDERVVAEPGAPGGEVTFAKTGISPTPIRDIDVTGMTLTNFFSEIGEPTNGKHAIVNDERQDMDYTIRPGDFVQLVQNIAGN